MTTTDNEHIEEIMQRYKISQKDAQQLYAMHGPPTPQSKSQSTQSYIESNKTETEENYSPPESQKSVSKFSPKKESEPDIVDEILKDIEEAEKESENP